ncbi:hypothetical protein ACFVTM_03890 [Arthrobacter sp. NPDC058130]|uniref:hypothetical protein n=1 Tax=Arthrobacter sp. NPDC058130 TaxID=3346353 RepID=UPI0036F08825
MNVKPRKFALCLAVSVAVAVSASACSNAPQSLNPSLPGTTPESAADPLARSKVDTFINPEGPAEQARDIVIAKCMHEAGFDWTPSTPSPVTVLQYFGAPPLSIEDARTRGYARASTGTEQESQQSDAAQAAFAGSPQSGKVSVDIFGSQLSISQGGCLAKSYAEVYGSAENGMKATGVSINAVLPAVNAASADPAIAPIQEKWSTCMKTAGFTDLRTPGEALRNFLQGKNRDQAVAIADAKCREQTGFQTAANAVLSKYLTAFLRDNEAMVTEIQSIRNAAGQTAQKILAGTQ